ncbi:MAG TPA: hypothetical protein VG167_04770 [Verrucomicrobiae bacterium]|nr:hypothetical protein [Verrucomicrobiae bacterium]
MRPKLIAAVVSLALLSATVSRAADPIWENWGNYFLNFTNAQYTPPIDAVTVVNHSGATFTVGTSSTFNTFDTVNYTNQGQMTGNPGFDFENIPSGDGVATWSSNFINQQGGGNNGTISCDGIFTFFITPQLPAGNLTGSSKCLVYASNIVNSGTINMSASSLIKMHGTSVDISRGAILMANPSDLFGFFTAGQLDGYWGVGTADIRYFNAPPNNAGQASLLNPTAMFPIVNGATEAIPDVYNITNRYSVPGFGQLVLFNPLVYTLTWVANNGTNFLTQVVALLNTNAAFTPSVYFSPNEIGVQWQWSSTNFPNGGVNSSNYLFLTDDFGEVTNLQTVIDGQAGPRLTYIPINYNFVQGTPYTTFNPFAIQGQPVSPGQIPFIPGVVTNDYSAYQAIFSAATELPTDVGFGNVTNLAGRIEITADKFLNLTSSRISSLNYLLLKSTNHFAGSRGAVISSPNLDLYLRTTNAILNVTNLVAPYLNHLAGTCDLWSARWTNVVGSVTNSFHVLFVDSAFSPVTAPLIQTLNLTVTNFNAATNNLVISDVLNVTANLLLKADTLTITTNPGNIFAPVGQLNILNPNIVWSTALPGLSALTNWGIITAQNAVYFGGSRSQPPYNTNIVDVPYQNFVNYGGITNQATLLWSTLFQNSGVFECGQGSFNLQKACLVTLTNGLIHARGGDIDLTGCSMLVSNHALLAGGALTLAVTNSLDDGSLGPNSADGITNKNSWLAGNGINLLVLPSQASLLGTTVTNLAADYALVDSIWAGADLGNTAAGFANNAALGRLILDGLTNNTYEFTPATGHNALYVDRLELLDFVAINQDGAGNWASLMCDPGMTVYYGQALANGMDISEKLNQVNNHQFQWVSNFNTGFFSSTNVVYTDGSTNRLNTALVTSCDIDSNGNGIPNCQDPNPIPVLSARSFALTVGVTNRPSPAALVSWSAFPGTTNYLLSATSAHATNWTVVTNFYYPGPLPGRVTVADLVRTNNPKFYRVRAVLR